MPVRVSARVGDATIWGVSLERGDVRGLIFWVLFWVGMRCPVGAGIGQGPTTQPQAIRPPSSLFRRLFVAAGAVGLSSARSGRRRQG